MKLTKEILLPSIVATLLLTGCASEAGQENVSDSLSAVEEARNHTAALENGTYTTIISTEGEGENSEQVVEGIFVVANDSFDWHTQMRLEQSEDTAILTEHLQKDATQYQRIQFVNAEGEPVGEEDLSAWQMTAEDISEEPLYLEELMNLDINEVDVESVEISEKENQTIYQFSYTEEYLSSMKDENIEALEEQIEEIASENPDNPSIPALEQSVEQMESVTYTSAALTVTVDEANVLTGYLMESSFEQSTDETTQTVHSSQEIDILDYNEPDIEIDVEI